MKNRVIVTFLPYVSVIKRAKFLPIRVRTRADGRGHADTDTCSLPNANEWFAFSDGHGYTDMDRCSLALRDLDFSDKQICLASDQIEIKVKPYF